MLRYTIITTGAMDADTVNVKAHQLMRHELAEVVTYSPFWDAHLSWFPNARVYLDSIAVYNPAHPDHAGDTVYQEHPDFAMTDALGNPLYINYGRTDSGIYPQYFAEITNPAYFDWFAAAFQALVAKGYRRIFLDDVDLDPATCVNAAGQPTLPVGMTEHTYSLALVTFYERFREAFPDVSIMHNSVWFARVPKDLADRQILAADLINIERGSGDPNLDAPKLQQLLAYIDRVHKLGRLVFIEEYFKANMAFALAMYYQGYQDGDRIGFEDLLPHDMDPASPIGIDLGEPLAPRELVPGPDVIYTRRFRNGYAMANLSKKTGLVELSA